MTITEIKDYLDRYEEEGKQMFTTSSFQTHSLVLLHIISRVKPEIPVYFINTGYHFPETLRFRDLITEQFGLKLIDLHTSTPRNMQCGSDGRLLFTSDPDYCCFLNKTMPLEGVLQSYDVWINGVRRDQSAVRKAMKTEQPAPHGTVRFHPMLDWNARQIFRYRKEYDLPEHTLDAQGYMSIGCEPCTRRIDPDMQEREARWYGLNKTECGLHTDLVSK
ncbi:phosphoadenylyl-sulfate reductase [Roseivirga sp. BDSF3-8]|uniref:phosphoadenylyl-sulfate reductase n=1 Tax=Roseivirga sp. BDSF3-8 TaxID=3241598 RepID=UPI003531BCDE